MLWPLIQHKHLSGESRRQKCTSCPLPLSIAIAQMFSFFSFLSRSQILTVCGATVKTLSDVQKSRGTIDVDCCLFDPISLPPHVVSQPTYVSNLMKSISSTAPRLDLAWAHQSIIQRKRLPLNGDDRYNVTLEYSMNTTCIVSSIKRKETRYEVGDLVQFRRDPKSVARSRGRITRIIFNRQEKSCKLEIQLLVRILCFVSRTLAVPN